MSAIQAAERLTRIPLMADPGFLLARANADSVAAANAALARHGLRVRSYALLTAAASGARPSQRELAEFLRLDPSQIVALVDELERAGLVRRETDAADRRTRIVTATESGVRALADAEAAAIEARSRVFGALTPAEQESLVDLLTRITSAEPGGARSDRQVS